MIVRRPFELAVAHTFSAGVVTGRGPSNARRAGWPLEIVADIVADDVVGLAVDIRHAHLGGDPEVAATVVSLADWRGVTVRRATGEARHEQQSLHAGGSVCGHHGHFGLSLTTDEQVVRQWKVMRLHPSDLDPTTVPDQRGDDDDRP